MIGLSALIFAHWGLVLLSLSVIALSIMALLDSPLFLTLSLSTVFPPDDQVWFKLITSVVFLVMYLFLEYKTNYQSSVKAKKEVSDV